VQDVFYDNNYAAVHMLLVYIVTVQKLGCVLLLLPAVFKENPVTWFCIDEVCCKNLQKYYVEIAENLTPFTSHEFDRKVLVSII
jgi:hypothetical protein